MHGKIVEKRNVSISLKKYGKYFIPCCCFCIVFYLLILNFSNVEKYGPSTLMAWFMTPVEPKVVNKLTEYLDNMNFILNPSVTFTRNMSQPTLLIIVISKVDNFHIRQTIRSSWGSRNFTEPFVKVVYILGLSAKQSLMTAVANEHDHYKDIIQADFIDSYKNLTIKSLAMLKWVSINGANIDYILKADDDVYVHIKNLQKVLKNFKDNNVTDVVGGKFNINMQPVRNTLSKWYVPYSEFSSDVFPKYLTGSSYLIDVSLVSKLYRASSVYANITIEDAVVTGLGVQFLGLKAIAIKGFQVGYKEDYSECLQNVVVRSDVDVKQMLQFHNILIRCPQNVTEKS